MQIEVFKKRLEKLSLSKPIFKFQFVEKAVKSDLVKTQVSLGVQFPEKLSTFFHFLNGLKTENPSLMLIPLSELQLKENRIHFATFDNTVQICLNTEKLNRANEWTIINNETDFVLTLSISSFWSNKIWHWLEGGKMIWSENWWEIT